MTDRSTRYDSTVRHKLAPEPRLEASALSRSIAVILITGVGLSAVVLACGLVLLAVTGRTGYHGTLGATECQTRIAAELKRIEEDYQNKRTVQSFAAMNLARLSPVSCYTYVISGLCATGVTEPDNFVANARRFQGQVEQAFYEKISWRLGQYQVVVKGFDRFKPPAFPDMVYHYPGLKEAMQVHWADMVLLGVFDVLFFSLAFMRFNKYDVR